MSILVARILETTNMKTKNRSKCPNRLQTRCNYSVSCGAWVVTARAMKGGQTSDGTLADPSNTPRRGFNKGIQFTPLSPLQLVKVNKLSLIFSFISHPQALFLSPSYFLHFLQEVLTGLNPEINAHSSVLAKSNSFLCVCVCRNSQN